MASSTTRDNFFVKELRGRDDGRKSSKRETPPPKNPEPEIPLKTFAEFGQDARDLLTKDFSTIQTISLTTTTPVGVNVSAVASKVEDLVLGMLTVCAVPFSGATVKLVPSTSGQVECTATFSELTPGLAASFSGTFPLPKSGRASLEYRHPHVSATASSGLYAKPVIDFSAAVGGFGGGLVLGSDIGYDFESQAVTKANAGLSIVQRQVSASVVTDVRRLDSLNIFLLQEVNPDFNLGLQLQHSLKAQGLDSLSYGMAYRMGPSSLVKARVDSSGTIAGSFKHDITPQSTLVITAEGDPFNPDKRAKIGLTMTVTQA